MAKFFLNIEANTFEEFEKELSAFAAKFQPSTVTSDAPTSNVKSIQTSKGDVVVEVEEKKPRKPKEKTVDPGDKEPEAKATPKYTLDSLREYLAEINRAGKKEQVLAIIKSHGVKALGELDESLYETVAAEAAKLIDDDALNM